jgi:hypothetical protein
LGEGRGLVVVPAAVAGVVVIVISAAGAGVVVVIMAAAAGTRVVVVAVIGIPGAGVVVVVVLSVPGTGVVLAIDAAGTRAAGIVGVLGLVAGAADVLADAVVVVAILTVGLAGIVTPKPARFRAAASGSEIDVSSSTRRMARLFIIAIRIRMVSGRGLHAEKREGAPPRSLESAR